ncbi:MAG: ROK family protein [Chloroflexota bacterium]
MSTTHLPKPFFVGLDIGGTKIEALLVDQEMNVCAQARRPTDISHPDNLAASAAAAIDEVLHQAGAERAQLGGIGIGIPGQVDPASGAVALAANLNLKAYPLGTVMSSKMDAPTFVENDVRIAAMGVYRWLQAQEPVTNIAYLSVGTGVAAGVVLNGRLHRGSHGMAGEIGHITLDLHGPKCNCGAHGCLETYVAGPAIVRQALGKVTFGVPDNEVHAGHVYQAAQNGSLAAQAIVQKASQHLSRAIQLLIMLYDVDKVVLGGGVAQSGSAFLAPIQAELALLRAEAPLFETLISADKITLLPAGYNAGTWGAVYLAQEMKEQKTKD